MNGLSVLATGMVSALGFNSAACYAAIRAGISGIRETHLADRESSEPLRGGKADLPHWWEALDKVADLVAPAIYECLLAAEEPANDIPILLGAPLPNRPGRWDELDHLLLNKVELRLGLPHHKESSLFCCGQTAGVHALIAARRLIDQEKARQCVVAGVDSYLQQETIDGYVRQRRIMTNNNSNGFLPGEAGAAVLVAATSKFRSHLLSISGLALTHEPSPIHTNEPFRANGMTDAIRIALAEAGFRLEAVDWRITDITGEHYKFKEANFAAGRLSAGTRKGIFDLWHPIEYIGEVGAAVVPVLLGLAVHAGQKGYACGQHALCHVGNDLHERSAWVTEFNQGVRCNE